VRAQRFLNAEGTTRILGAMMAALTTGDGVELDAAGLPAAFRIWRGGSNETDMGDHKFTKKSAALVMAEQAKRGNELSIDVDHMSLNDQAPIENHAAVGWHKLDVRDGEGGPELWAVDVRWAARVQAGLKAQPPEWKFFSPAYDVNKAGEIVSYLNLALTNNPATWGVTALATAAAATPTAGATMSAMTLAAICASLFGEGRTDAEKSTAKAALKAMAEKDGPDKEKAGKMHAAFGDPDEAPPKKEEPAKAAEEAPKVEANKGTEEEKAAAGNGKDEPPKATASAKADAADGDEEKARKAASAIAQVGKLERDVAELKGIRDAEERKRIYATRPDLTKAQLEMLNDEPVGRLAKLLSFLPPPPVDPAAAARVTATRGRNADGSSADSGGYGLQRAARLPPAEHKEVAESMGLDMTTRTIHWDPAHTNDLVFPQLEQHEAERILAARRAAGTDRNPNNPGVRSAYNNGGGNQ
jgi:phage I-like protein